MFPVVGIAVGFGEVSMLGAGVASVGIADGTGDGPKYVGASVGLMVGAAVGLAVGSGVSSPGKYVGDSVGATEGVAVGAAEGEGVGAATVVNVSLTNGVDVTVAAVLRYTVA